MKNFLNSDYLRGVQLYQNTVQQERNTIATDCKRYTKRHFDQCFDFCMFKTSIKLLCFVHGHEHKFVSAKFF